MYSTIISGAIFGISCYLVQVEVDMSRGLPCFTMVGSLGSEVRESGERVRIALKNAGVHLPPMHIAVNLSPGDIKKEGTGFDLPIAAAVLVSMEQIPAKKTDHTLMLGELGLSGEIKPVKGVLPIVKEARAKGIKRCLVPGQNVKEAAVIDGIKAVGVSDIRQVIDYLTAPEEEQDELIAPSQISVEELLNQKHDKTGDFSEVTGQEGVKRAAVIAAAGFHNLLISGPPGSGKTMIAKRLPGILPPLTREESLEVSSIYSISGLLDNDCSLITERPFLSPHHTISAQALSGGGRIPRPGVISLAHRGILFLDELPEFKRQTLDILRQPIEDKKIQIARSCGTFSYPADVMILGAMNPCPCGYYPDRNRCRCTPFEIHNYISHISGPILDRIDICIQAPKVEISQLQSSEKGQSSESLRGKVMRAREKQRKRFEGTAFRFNADLRAGDVEKYCPLRKNEKKMLEDLFHTMDLSARAYHRLIKVARTIADIEESEEISEVHLAEAVCYRAEERIYGGEE